MWAASGRMAALISAVCLIVFKREIVSGPPALSGTTATSGPSEETDQTALRATRIRVTSNSHPVCCGWRCETLGRSRPKGVTGVPIRTAAAEPGGCSQDLLVVNLIHPWRWPRPPLVTRAALRVTAGLHPWKFPCDGLGACDSLSSTACHSSCV
jgi:hypothetical protein